MTAYHIQTEEFAGPIEKLLELIEERKLDITRVSLAEVTSDFLNYVHGLEHGIPSGVLADFIVVASRLLLIKSKALLPSLELTEEEETEIHDLEKRLKLYREFKATSPGIQTLWMGHHELRARPFFMGTQIIFYPPPGITHDHLYRSIASLFKNLLEFQETTREIKSVVMSLEDKMNEVLARIHNLASQSFKDLAQGRKRNEVIILFLAILHLIRDQAIQVEQKTHFDDMIISATS